MLTLDNHFPDRRICILGLGYVGLTMAVSMADAGFDVIGVEIRDDVLEKLKKGEPHFFEPGLKELLQRLVRRKKINFHKYIPSNCDATVFIVTVGTPLLPSGRVRMQMVESVGLELSRNIKEGDLVILRSTVKIGTTRKVVKPLLEKASVRFDLAFCPERTLEGQALKELRHLPQIIGGMDTSSAVRASQIFQFMTPTIVRVSDLETAETIKLIDNAHRDVLFSYSNEVARICDTVGISAQEVVSAGKLGYARTNIPMPGLVGGPCLEKDSHIMAEGLRELGYKPAITLLSRQLNEDQPEEVVRYISRRLKNVHGKKPLTISLMGIAFKGRPVTDDLRGTMAKPILASVKKHFPKARLRGFDAVVRERDMKNFGLNPVSSLPAAFKGAHLVLILNNHPVFSEMPIESLSEGMASPGLIYDFWNSFSAKSLHMPPARFYMALGSHGHSAFPLRRT